MRHSYRRRKVQLLLKMWQCKLVRQQRWEKTLGGESELNSVSGDDFKREYEDVYTERSDEENAYQKLCLFYEALFRLLDPVTYANFLNGFNTSGFGYG